MRKGKTHYWKWRTVKMSEKGYPIQKEKYLCNEAVTPTKERMTRDWDYVTCSRCKRERKANE